MKFIANPVEVDAWPITEISELAEDGSRRIHSGDRGWVADAGMLARLTNLAPIVGDYMVLQADGYLYLNPKHVFERKYRPDDGSQRAFLIGPADLVAFVFTKVGDGETRHVSTKLHDFVRGYRTMSRETFYEAWIRPALEQLLGPSPAAEPNALELGAMARAAGLAGE